MIELPTAEARDLARAGACHGGDGMSLQQVTPAGGAASVAVTWDNSSITVPTGVILDIPPGSALESAYGLGT